MTRIRALLLYSMIFLVVGFSYAQDILVVTSSTTGLEQSIAYDDIITVQPQGSDDRAMIVYGSNYGLIVTLEVYDDVINYQKCRLLDFTNRVSGRRTAVPYSAIDAVLNTGAQGGATINVSIDQYGYSALFTTVEKYDQVFPQWAECESQVQRPVYDVVNVGYGVPVGKKVVDGKLQLRSLVGTNGTTITERAGVIEIDGGGSGGGSGGDATNLSVTPGTTSVIIESSTGAPATLFPASATEAGVMTADDDVKLEGVEAGATGDQTPSEIVAAVNSSLGNTDWQAGGASGGFTYEARGTSPNNYLIEGNKTYFVSNSNGAGNTDLQEVFLDLSSLAIDEQFEIVLRDDFPLRLNSIGATITFVLQGDSGGGQSTVTLEAGSSYRLAHSSANSLSVFKIDSPQSGGATNLSYTSSATTGTLTSSTGTSATIPVTSSAESGLFLPSEKLKLSALTPGATDDQTGPEIQSLLDAHFGGAAWRINSPVIDDDTFETASSTSLSSSESIKAYVLSRSGGVREEDVPAGIGSASISSVRHGGTPTLFSGSSSGYQITFGAGAIISELYFYGNNTTANSSGELVIVFDNSSNSSRRFFTVSILDGNSNQLLDMFSLGLVPTITSNALASTVTMTIPNIAGNFPGGFTAILR